MQKITRSSSKKQKGIALFVVIIFVMMSMLLALWASRTALFSEMIVGNDADYQRTFEAAQSLLQDAELDIRGEQANGSNCVPSSGNPEICRTGDSVDKFPLEQQEVGKFLSDLDQQPTKCRNALCVKRTGKQDFWNNDNSSNGITLAQMAVNGVGARYGQYTGANTGNSSNPILADRTESSSGGWYWIEVLPYDPNAGNSGLITNGSTNLPLHIKPNVIYRITAIANGLKPNTQVILQQTYVRQKRKD